MGGFGGEGEFAGLGPEPEKDKNLTEAASYIYEDVKDIFSEDIKETKKNQGIMSPTFFDNNDKDDNDAPPPTILENVTDVAKAFMGFFGKANPLLGVAAGITASISGSSVAEQLEKVRKIDTPFDYNKVYNQYLETPKTGLVTIPSRAKTAAAFKGSLSDESMFVPTTLGSFTPPPSTPTGYGAGTDETMFVPTPTGEPYSLNRPIPRPLGMGAKIKAQEDERTRIIDKLAMSESSNNFAADNKLGYIGRLQFGAGRLKDFTDATGRSTANFKNTPSLQKRVEQWHIKDLESFIIKNKLDDYYGKVIGGVVVDKDAIIAMAHLGGKTGAKKFLDTKGSYNKRDKLGTYMSDYGKKFSAAIEPLYNDMQKIVDPVPVKRPTIDTTTQTSETTTDNEDNLPDEGDPFDLRSVPIDTILDPSIYLFDTNDREEKIEILKEMGIIQLASYTGSDATSSFKYEYEYGGPSYNPNTFEKIYRDPDNYTKTRSDDMGMSEYLNYLNSLDTDNRPGEAENEVTIDEIENKLISKKRSDRLDIIKEIEKDTDAYILRKEETRKKPLNYMVFMPTPNLESAKQEIPRLITLNEKVVEAKRLKNNPQIIPTPSETRLNKRRPEGWENYFMWSDRGEYYERIFGSGIKDNREYGFPLMNPAYDEYNRRKGFGMKMPNEPTRITLTPEEYWTTMYYADDPLIFLRGTNDPELKREIMRKDPEFIRLFRELKDAT